MNFPLVSDELKLSHELQPYLEDAISVGFPTPTERIIIVACKRIAKMRTEIDRLKQENKELSQNRIGANY